MSRDQKGTQAVKGRQANPRRRKSDENDEQGDRSQRDQLDDRGRQRHIGHDEPEADQGNRRPLGEGDPNEDLGRPVRVGEDEPDRKSPGPWEDKTEGTSRP
jgi:hypothetical protein